MIELIAFFITTPMAGAAIWLGCRTMKYGDITDALIGMFVALVGLAWLLGSISAIIHRL